MWLHYQETLWIQRTSDKFPEWPELHPLLLTCVCVRLISPYIINNWTYTCIHTAVAHIYWALCTTHEWTLMNAQFHTGAQGDIDLFIPQAALLPVRTVSSSRHSYQTTHFSLSHAWIQKPWCTDVRDDPIFLHPGNPTGQQNPTSPPPPPPPLRLIKPAGNWIQNSNTKQHSMYHLELFYIQIGKPHNTWRP